MTYSFLLAYVTERLIEELDLSGRKEEIQSRCLRKKLKISESPDHREESERPRKFQVLDQTGRKMEGIYLEGTGV